MPLRIDILTLFPEMFAPVLGTSIPKRAAEKGLVSYHTTQIRDFATDQHKSVDDKPFGGGPGMVMMCQTLFDAVEHAEAQDPRPARRLLMSPQGRRLDQAMVLELAAEQRLLFIAGHYEGFDERIIDGLKPEEISIGDYVLSGGELAAMVIIDAIVRTLPGALGAETGAHDESFADGLLEYPQYTRPREFRGMSVPEILLSGNHSKIAAWRLEQRKLRTEARRPDLWSAYRDRKTEQ
ncbi:tRNA (guanosine(37)-N1)-methyltransferase TrmD [Humisphaera borealis]|uniref:tRNA (guanine-N(1)-)-methyltransferase n=1 Tax=Humisphaera borealis TaxID=2807512 RepID=A0A7M2X1P6_9BACT|nr:tRNA (guanosine(37)-N1)-methyltransferase TrmD [Humisphaera borealis]QOV91668.1 tRNA (guanosine(37)-N1)-methyltransferase TrmD [Humisphaera borealis]